MGAGSMLMTVTLIVLMVVVVGATGDNVDDVVVIGAAGDNRDDGG